MTRRLAAVLAADVVGYSANMEKDEQATLAALRHLRQEILEPVISEHGGRIIKSMGDGWLIEHSSAQAIVASDAAVAADERDAYALATASQAKAQAGLSEDALPLAQRAIRNNPYLPPGHAIASLCYFQLGRYEEAKEAGDQALELNPNDPFRSMVRTIRGM